MTQNLQIATNQTLMLSLFGLFFFFFLHSEIGICNGVSVLDLKSLKSNEFDLMGSRRGCSGKIGECSAAAAAVEEEMDSEINRRVLMMQKKYISYETLKRDLVPCGTPGASYYNCKGSSGEANHYNRGCEVITRCARGTRDVKS